MKTLSRAGEPELVHTSLRLPRDLWAEARKAAVTLHISVQRLVWEALYERLGTPKSKRY